MAILSRLLSLGPRITQRHGALVAATPRRVLLLNLGAYYREVVADPQRKEITLYRRLAWFFMKRRTAKFSKFKAVTYGYRDDSLTTWFNTAHDSFDVFSVGLRAESGEEFHLFDFVGDGTFTNNSAWGDWQYWDQYLFDLSGGQESESRAYVEVLSKMMGLAVSPPSILGR